MKKRTEQQTQIIGRIYTCNSSPWPVKSPKDQEAACRAAARTHGWAVLEDHIYSADHIDLKSVVDFDRANPYRRIIVAHASCLGGGFERVGMVLDRARLHGVTVHIADLNLDTDHPDFTAAFAVMSYCLNAARANLCGSD